MSFDYNRVKTAYGRISPYICRTPLARSFYLGSDRRNIISSWSPCKPPRASKSAEH